MKVYIVEDNVDLQAIYRGVFSEAGHEVAVASDGLTAISEIADVCPDVVLLDIMMPEMDGFEFLQALNDNTSMKTCVIVCSNLSSQQDINKAMSNGASAYLQKSDYVGDELVQAVQEAYTKSLH